MNVLLGEVSFAGTEWVAYNVYLPKITSGAFPILGKFNSWKFDIYTYKEINNSPFGCIKIVSILIQYFFCPTADLDFTSLFLEKIKEILKRDCLYTDQ